VASNDSQGNRNEKIEKVRLIKREFFDHFVLVTCVLAQAETNSKITTRIMITIEITAVRSVSIDCLLLVS
jgi:hypothetical protein